MQWRSPDQVGLTGQRAARPSASSPRARRCRAGTAGCSVAEPQGPHCLAHSHMWLWLTLSPGQSSVGVKREDFLETSVLQRLRGLEQAAALVSPCTGLSACVFALSTAVLDRPPAHPFTSLKGPQPLLQHLKRQCLERQWCRNDRQNWSNYCTLFLKAPAIAFFLGGNPSQWLSGSSDFHQLQSCISEIILSASFPTP